MSNAEIIYLLLLVLIGLVRWSVKSEVDQARNHTDIGDRNLDSRINRIEQYLDDKLRGK